MKDKEKKHKGESTIGKIIYGFMLFLPLFAIGTTCLYAIFNKNAYQSYSSNTTIKQTEIVDSSIYTINEEYEINVATFFNELHSTRNTIYSPKFYIETNTIDFNTLLGLAEPLTENEMNLINGIQFRTYTTSTNWIYISLYEDNTRLYDLQFFTDRHTTKSNKNIYEIENIELYAIDLDISSVNYYPQKGITKITTRIDKLNNVFYLAIDKVKENDLFNWTTNTAIFTGILATANTLGITNTFIPMLMTYWLIVSVLYFLYDIILMGLNILHKKIHELQESI